MEYKTRQRRKRVVAGLLLSTLISSLTGCGGYDEISELNSISALNSEASVSTNYNLSYADRQEMIYAQVSDRTLLDLSTLDQCTDNELQQVVNYLNSVDNQLIGTLKSTQRSDITGKVIGEDTGAIDACFTDYLLAEFEKTPYYWQRSKTVVRGIDAESRSIIVDVTYNTIGFEKEVKLDSKIVLGEPNYMLLLENRFHHWLKVLSTKYHNDNVTEYQKLYTEFVDAYGDPEEIYESQSNDTLTDWIYKTGNQLTYTGCINSEAEQTGATMVVRYVLVPNYVLGINLGITCKHMYVLDYKVDNDCTEGLSVFTAEGYATVTDSVYDLLYSYFTCIDESDFDGLYKLSYDFGSLDKYYKDMFDTSYRKHNNFSITLFDIKGTHITCGVTVASKIRAKGSDMTFPNYTDRYFVEIELVDGVLQVKNMVLLSRTIEGEPAITTDDAEVGGFTAAIDLNNDDKLAIEGLICDFGALQLLRDISSDDFSATVDLSMSTSMLSSLQTNMMSVTGKNKVVWLQNYQQGTSNYASVRCRELFQSDDNSIVEVSTTYDFILKGGKWYVYGYDINGMIKLDTTNLSTTGSLCLLSPGKIESYTSQLKSTVSESLDNASDTSVTFEHKEYTPVLKTGIEEQGLVQLQPGDVTEEIFNEVAESHNWGITDRDVGNYYNILYQVFVDAGLDESLIETAITELDTCVAVYYNITYSRYDDGDLEEISSVKKLEYQQLIDQLRLAQGSLVDTDHIAFIGKLIDIFDGMMLIWV